ncbi:MAG: ABC transporter permease [Bacteroidales bacterium]|nr:ABC transporter permease [Bacteroidales bacterium]
MNFKHFMGAYIVIVPFAILLILRGFIPTVESTTTTIAVVSESEHAVSPEMIRVLDQYAKIKTYLSIEDMYKKLRGVGTVEGLYWDPAKQQFVSVLQKTPKGNSAFSLAAQVIRQQYLHKNYPGTPPVMTFEYDVPKELSHRTKISPVATMGGSIFFVFLILIAGFVIGLGIVDDKENGTDKALHVSPVSKSDYFIGKSIYPLLIIAFYSIIALLVLGLIHVNILQVYLLVIVSFSITLLFGLLLGALANNETEAVGVGKLLSMLMMLAILGGVLLPDAWQWAVWWAPFYWVYDVLQEIFTETVTWTSLAWKSAVTVGLTLFYFLLLRKKIIKGLS